jgi:hypothetical protein
VEPDSLLVLFSSFRSLLDYVGNDGQLTVVVQGLEAFTFVANAFGLVNVVTLSVDLRAAEIFPTISKYWLAVVP